MISSCKEVNNFRGREVISLSNEVQNNNILILLPYFDLFLPDFNLRDFKQNLLILVFDY